MAKQVEIFHSVEAMTRAFAAHFKALKRHGGGDWQPSGSGSVCVRVTDDEDASYQRDYVVLVGWGVRVYRIQYLTDGSWRLKQLKRIPAELKEIAGEV